MPAQVFHHRDFDAAGGLHLLENRLIFAVHLLGQTGHLLEEIAPLPLLYGHQYRDAGAPPVIVDREAAGVVALLVVSVLEQRLFIVLPPRRFQILIHLLHHVHCGSLAGNNGGGDPEAVGLGHHRDTVVVVSHLSTAGHEGIQKHIILEHPLRRLEERLAAVVEAHVDGRAELFLIVFLCNGRSGKLEVFQHIQQGAPRQLLLGIVIVDALNDNQGAPLGQSRAGVGGLLVGKPHRPEIIAIGDSIVPHAPEKFLTVRAEAADIFSLRSPQRNLGGFLAYTVLQGYLVGEAVLLVLQLGCGRLEGVIRPEDQAV